MYHCKAGTPTRRMVLPITEAKSVGQRGPLAPNSEQLSHSIPPSSFLIPNSECLS